MKPNTTEKNTLLLSHMSSATCQRHLNKSMPCIFHHKIESSMGQQYLVSSKPMGLSRDRSTQVAATQDLRATTGQWPMCHGQDAYTGWWSLCGCENCNLTKLGACHLTLNKTNLLMPGCAKGKYRVYCRVPSKRVENKPQIYSRLVFELRLVFFVVVVIVFLRGRTKRMVLIIIHFLIQVFRFRMTLVFDSLSMTQGLLAHLALDKKLVFVH